MKLTKLFGKSIQILLIYFVTASYQLVNENVKGDNKGLTKKPNQILTRNVGRLVTPVTAQKLSGKVSPSQITPQPLLKRRKVQLNPTDAAKPKGLINNNKTPSSVKVDKPKPKPNSVECKDGKANVDAEPETKKQDEESSFSDEVEDIPYKLENDKVDESKQDISVCKKELQENISETNKEDGTGMKEFKNKEVVPCKDIKTQKQEETEESDSAPNLSSEDDDDDVPIDIHEEYKIRSKEPKKNSAGGGVCSAINPPEQKKVLKITDVPSKVDNHVQPKENSKKKIIYEAKPPRVTHVEINVSPQVMKKLTNDANDKILIKKLDFEELEEKYDPDSCADDGHKPNDSPYSPDTTFIKEPYKYPLEDQIDIDAICDNPIINKRFPSVSNRSLRERIWRTWQNSEIHVKSDYDIKNKQKNAKKSKPNIHYNDAKQYVSVYSNSKNEPVYSGTYKPTANQNNKPNNVQEVICVDGNVESAPVNYGTYKATENQANVTDISENTSVDVAPFDDKYNYNVYQSIRPSNVYDVPRFINYNRVHFGPFGYGGYNPNAYYGARPRNLDNLRRYYSGYGMTGFGPFMYEPYNTIPQRYPLQGMAPANTGIRYYSANEYSTPPIPNCFYPQSFGNQYAPVSRYQKYLFPCM